MRSTEGETNEEEKYVHDPKSSKPEASRRRKPSVVLSCLNIDQTSHNLNNITVCSLFIV